MNISDIRVSVANIDIDIIIAVVYNEIVNLIERSLQSEQLNKQNNKTNNNSNYHCHPMYRCNDWMVHPHVHPTPGSTRFSSDGERAWFKRQGSLEPLDNKQNPEPIKEPIPVAKAPEKPLEPSTAPIIRDCESELGKYDWDIAMARAIGKAESGLTASSVGDKSLQYVQDSITYGASYGCFQIRYLPGRPEPELLLDPAFNVQYAYMMFTRSGWGPWSAYNNGSYLKYMK